MMETKLQFPTPEEVTQIETYVRRKEDKNIIQLKKDALQWTRTAW
jgi:hypothetical protein